jgi:hypothetical protein
MLQVRLTASERDGAAQLEVTGHRGRVWTLDEFEEFVRLATAAGLQADREFANRVGSAAAQGVEDVRKAAEGR